MSDSWHQRTLSLGWCFATRTLTLTLTLTLTRTRTRTLTPTLTLTLNPHSNLGQIVRNFEPLLVAARADRHQMEFDRQMREEQAEEYARALAEDQARCREIWRDIARSRHATWPAAPSPKP